MTQDNTQDQTKNSNEPSGPPPGRLDMHIRMENGQMMVDAPQNFMLCMSMISMAMDILIQNFGQKMLNLAKQQESRIIQPGLAAVDPRIITAAKGNGK